ncbi:MAG: IS200/IS605 family element transposase accessory protein TnpB [Okeania sp. SIO2C9]|uniref:IS200/IS605 family accessory protein TnpB-related protein n=1 Tax=Okeania sp. SIO2C9 TaxID=2607791 RepID=UPI0013C063A8|nr:IS200/IS605 family accessory protein TnpB-related protein [Okeania sp. SIO2C9]NEQ74011.1 IS200/IS605 family element transposase accessory protein TnpB [Okeania sp. SIO2C9]
MAKSHGSLIGIEAKIEYHPVFEELGALYESWKRSAVNWIQTEKLSESEVEKRLMKRFNIQWAWADSIATEATQCLSQLKTAKNNNITKLELQIQAKTTAAKKLITKLEKTLKLATKKGFPHLQARNKFFHQLLGLKSKIQKIKCLKRKLKKLKNTERLHICFGSKRLFNAQHNLAENGYKTQEEWGVDWIKKRSGRCLCVGKSQPGGGTMLKVFPLQQEEGLYQLQVQLPRPLQDKYGQKIQLEFSVSDRDGRYRATDLDYAINSLKPITIQIFRREHKQDNWYVHLSTYVPEIPVVHTRKNGCLGIDFNAESISVAYVKWDGNIEYLEEIPYKWKNQTTGQRQASMRNIVSQIVKLAEFFECAIAIESLNFSKKKSKMSEESKVYNEMLSNLSTAIFREAILSRCRRFGVELIKVNPAFTSVIGMINYMAKYGLNSGTAAALVIGRRALKLSEKIPQCLLRPEDVNKHDWSHWRRVASFIKLHRIQRTQLFQWRKALEGILTHSLWAEHQLSQQVHIETGE